MMWVVEVVQARVLAVDRERILCEVVRANAEKVRFFLLFLLSSLYQKTVGFPSKTGTFID